MSHFDDHPDAHTDHLPEFHRPLILLGNRRRSVATYFSAPVKPVKQASSSSLSSSSSDTESSSKPPLDAPNDTASNQQLPRPINKVRSRVQPRLPHPATLDSSTHHENLNNIQPQQENSSPSTISESKQLPATDPQHNSQLASDRGDDEGDSHNGLLMGRGGRRTRATFAPPPTSSRTTSSRTQEVSSKTTTVTKPARGRAAASQTKNSSISPHNSSNLALESVNSTIDLNLVQLPGFGPKPAQNNVIALESSNLTQLSTLTSPHLSLDNDKSSKERRKYEISYELNDFPLSLLFEPQICSNVSQYAIYPQQSILPTLSQSQITQQATPTTATTTTTATTPHITNLNERSHFSGQYNTNTYPYRDICCQQVQKAADTTLITHLWDLEFSNFQHKLATYIDKIQVYFDEQDSTDECEDDENDVLTTDHENRVDSDQTEDCANSSTTYGSNPLSSRSPLRQLATKLPKAKIPIPPPIPSLIQNPSALAQIPALSEQQLNEFIALSHVLPQIDHEFQHKRAKVRPLAAILVETPLNTESTLDNSDNQQPDYPYAHILALEMDKICSKYPSVKERVALAPLPPTLRLNQIHPFLDSNQILPQEQGGDPVLQTLADQKCEVANFLHSSENRFVKRFCLRAVPSTQQSVFSSTPFSDGSVYHQNNNLEVEFERVLHQDEDTDRLEGEKLLKLYLNDKWVNEGYKSGNVANVPPPNHYSPVNQSVIVFPHRYNANKGPKPKEIGIDQFSSNPVPAAQIARLNPPHQLNQSLAQLHDGCNHAGNEMEYSDGAFASQFTSFDSDSSNCHVDPFSYHFFAQ